MHQLKELLTVQISNSIHTIRFPLA